MTAVEICRNAGRGASLALRVGGKISRESGTPINLKGTVRSIIEDHRPHGLGRARAPLGTSFRFEADGIDLMLSSQRNQIFSSSAFEDHGIRLVDRRVVVVKSIEHFRAAFSPIATEVLYVSTPGALRTDFENIPYSHRNPDFWPCIEHPRIGPFVAANRPADRRKMR